MRTLDVKGFNQYQNEILVIDTNLNDEIDPSDRFIAVNLPGFQRGEKVPYEHPRFEALRREYLASLQN